ncbi:MAG TPA: hypothetical protein VFW85_02475 [Gaiellaceae bacterium]|nr:hypothetical protein [Gaiellaceae bacterium]
MSGPLVFIHVPKTGGSTFLSVLRRNFPTSDVLLPDAQKGKNLAEIDDAFGRLGQARSIHGHVPLSYRDRLPANARYAALLRDPVRRQYSHYQWLYGRKLAAGKHWPVERALRQGRLVDNLQTRMLSGLEDPFTRPADDELLGAALVELEGLAFVGLVERFPESMLLAQERLGLRHISYVRRNVRGTTHPPEDVDALRAHNQLDLQLYAHAVAMLEPELDRLQSRAASLLRAERAMSSVRPTADLVALGYVADYGMSAIGARTRRALRWR